MEVVRKDLNKITKGFQLVNVKSRFSTRPVCRVTFYNGHTMDFNDKDGLQSLLSVYKEGGLKIDDVIESVQLVEETRTGNIVLSNGEFDEDTNTYICVLYTLKPQNGKSVGRKFRFFVDGRSNIDIIDFLYSQFKRQEKLSGSVKS